MLPRAHRKKPAAAGFALLFVIFLVALVLIGASVAILRIKTQGLRQREADMIWRGEQYQRAIGLYYRKNGRYPTSLDDLVKGTPGLRYLREAYKDPMNRTDGSWRLIYVTPAGQLIGSVRYVTLQEMALADRARIMGLQMGQGTGSDNGEGANPSASSAGDNQNPSANPNSTPPNSPPGAPPAGGGGTGTPPGTQPPDQSGQSTNGQSANSQPPNPQQPGAPQPVPPQPTPFGLPLQSQPSTDQMQDATILGGFIVGVASKIDKPSLKTYKGGATYKQWEFIYNPLEQVQTVGGGAIIGGATGNANGFGLPVPQPPQPQIPH